MKRLGAILLMLLVTVFTFLPALRNGFVNWDDDLYVTENPHIRSLSLKSLGRIFRSFYAGNYQPVTMLSYCLDYQFSGLNPGAFHRTSLLAHLVNCILLYGLMLVLSQNVFIAFLTALLFGIHPLHVESVVWISARKDLISCFFFLCALLFYVFYLKARNRLFFTFSLILFVLSLLSKAMGLMFPFVLLLCDHLVNKKITRRDILEKGSFFLISACFGALAIFAQHSSGAIGTEYINSFLRNIGFASAAILFYLAKALVPGKLSCFYTYPKMLPLSLLVLSFSGVVLLSGAVLYSLRFTRKLFFGLAFFLACIFPVLQFVPIGQTVVADRYTYLSFIGLFFVIAEVFRAMLKKGKVLTILALIPLAASLSFISWKRCSVWADSVTLWSDAVSHAPGEVIPLNNRGQAYYERGEFDRALADFNHIVRINPLLGKTYYNRGNVLRAQGKFAEAIAEYTAAIALDKQDSDWYNERGISYQLQGDLPKALSDYDEALRLDPRSYRAYINRGILFRQQGQSEMALADYAEAIRLEPFLGLIYQNRAVAYADLKEYGLAWADIQQALRLGVRVPQELIEDVRKGVRYD